MSFLKSIEKHENLKTCLIIVSLLFSQNNNLRVVLFGGSVLVRGDERNLLRTVDANGANNDALVERAKRGLAVVNVG